MKFPIYIKFNLIGHKIEIVDSDGNNFGFIRAKILAIKEHVEIYNNESQSELLYELRATQFIDFGSTYNFTNGQGYKIGSIAQEAFTSLVKASYKVTDSSDNYLYHISEANPWAKVMDSFFSEIPVLGLLSGMMFNPSYNFLDNNNIINYKLTKIPSLLSREFRIDANDNINTQDNSELAILSFIMLLFLERHRG
jgi:uncharacterized protein YxjI